jgi:FkbM family methyltransferase
MRVLRQAALRIYASILRVLKPNAGLTRLSFNPITNWMFSGIESSLQVKLRSGPVLEVDADEYHGRILWLVGSNDWKVSRTVNALLSEGDIFLDIGANYSSIGLDAASKVGKAGHVHLFEPQTVLADRVTRSFQQAGLTNVSLHRVALSDEAGEVTLSGPAHHRGMATILTEEEMPRARGLHEVVEMHDTAEYLRPIVAGHTFGVKIDIEGAEPKVLPGLAGFEGLKFVVFEGANFTEWLWDFFTSNGMTIFGLLKSPFVARVRVVRSFDEWDDFHDFVAFRTEGSIPDGNIALTDLATLCRPPS